MMRRCACVPALALAAVIVAGFSGMSADAKEYKLPPLNAANFSTPVDNAYMPMAIGDTYVYEAEDEDGLVVNEITNTAATKVILGVTCVVTYDVEWIYVEDLATWFMTEETYDWYAWDNWGNVWYFGEDTVEYLYDDEWNPAGTSTEGSWEAGVDGAEPGIVMLAEPKRGLSYRQEYYEDEAEDRGKVLSLNARVSVEYGDFDDCLKTKEWTTLERGVIEHKYYAPGVGLVYIEERRGKTVRVQLVDIY